MRYRNLVIVIAVAAAGAAATACDTFRSGAGLVARAGEHGLTIAELAPMLARGRGVPLRRDVVERFVHRWVEYSLYAQQVAAGDSMLDSLWIVRTMWPDLEQARVDAHHKQLVAQRVRLDSAALDSAYQAGQMRGLYHVLIRTRADMTPAQRAQALRRAEEARRRLVAGEPFARINEQYNEDTGARPAGGSLGIVTREELVPEFAEVAFSLAPGEISEVTETGFGYHVIWRAELAQVGDLFRRQLETELVKRMDSLYLEELAVKWNVALRDDAPATAREAAERPLELMGSAKALASYRGGRFTVADFIRWLQMLPPQMHEQALSADDAQMREFLMSLVRNEVLVKETIALNVPVPEEEFRSARQRYARNLDQLEQKLMLDSALAGATGRAERVDRAKQAVDRYFGTMLSSLRDIVIVPAFLASELRRGGRWQVYAAGVDRVIQEATVLRNEQLSGPSTGAGADSTPAER